MSALRIPHQRNVVFVLALLAAACSGSTTERVERRLRAADAYLASGKLAKSRVELEAALALAPERPDIHVRLGTVHAAAGRFARAADEFRAALARDPRETVAYVAWGDALAAEGRRAEAVPLWRHAYLRAPTQPLLERLGVGVLELGRARKATRVFEHAARRSTPKPDVVARWGAALEDLGDIDHARQKYEEALEADAAEPLALRRLGSLLARQPGSRDRGIDLLERLTRLSPTDAGALEAVGRACLAAGRYDEAQGMLRRAVAATRPGAPERGARSEALRSVEAMIPRAVPLPDAPNVLLVVIDTLRADHVGCYGYGRETTPAIDRLAAEGAVFETAISQAPWTGASVATLLTGLYPSVHGLDRGARWEDGPSAGRQLPFLLQRTLDPSVPTLASTLRRSGYRTAAFVSNVYMSSIFGLGTGFDIYDDASDDYAEDVMVAKRRSEDTNALVFRWLAARTAEPIFLLVHYNDPHWPYDPPGPLAARWTRGYSGPLIPADTAFVVESRGQPVEDVTPSDLAYLVGLYDGEIAHVDQNVERLVDRVRALGYSRSWLTVIVADHGEEFLDHGSASHGYTLFDEQLRVPLIVHQPGRIRPGRIPAQVRLVDVMPTIRDLVGIREGGPEMQGESLVPLLEGDRTGPPRDAFSEAPLLGDLRAVRRSDGLKLIEDRRQRRTLVFDLKTDPRENVNLSSHVEVRVESLAVQLGSWAQANQSFLLARGRGTSPKEAVVDDATRRRLTALGYVR